MYSFPLAITLLTAILVVSVIVAIRRKHLRVEYSVAWLAGAMLVLLLSLPTRLLATLGRIFGANSPETALVYVLIGSILFVCFHYGTVISRLRDDATALAQRLAIAELELRRLRGER